MKTGRSLPGIGSHQSAGRLTFHNGDGTPGRYNGGAPSALIGYGSEAARRLHEADLTGKLTGHLVVPV